MRVAHVITRMIIGGAQENTLYNCLDLVKDFGDEVLLLTGPATGPEGQLLDQGEGGRGQGSGQKLSRELDSTNGLKVHRIHDLCRPIHPLHDLRAYRQLTGALHEFRPQVVHTHSAKGGFLGRAAAWNLNVPLVIHTVHGAPFHPYQNPLARNLFIQLERWAAGRCHHLISVADAMTDLMVKAGVAPREKFTTIYSGMEVEPFANCSQFRAQARRELGLNPDDVVFGKIARLFKLKGHEYLIAAAELVVRQNPACKFLLVGDGIYRQRYEQQIRAAGLGDHFLFTGLVPPEKVPYYLSAMDCLVHTSLREGLARTLPQALIAGKPVISYDVDGAREVTIPGETGFLLPPKSIEPLAEAILELSRSEAWRHQLGRRGAERFTDQFRHQTMTRQIRELYVRVLEQGGPPGLL